MHGLIRRMLPALALVSVLSGCGESAEDAYDRGFEEGYEEGQRLVCREIAMLAPAVKTQVRNCRGF